MNKTFRKIVGGALAVTALMGLAACGSKTEGDKAEGKTYKVGIVQFVDDASLNQIEAAIEAELDAKAKELGVTFDYTLYNGQGDATTLNQIGAELVGKGVDLIVPIATPAVKIMQSATEDTEIPIVFSAVSDPVGSGIVDALDAPGGRITGTEVTAEHPEGISFGMYHADQYVAPEGQYTTVHAVDGTAWYKQYAVDAVDKSPYMAPDGSIAFNESIVKKLPPAPRRKDKI